LKAKITRIDKGLPLPKYETEGAAAFDFVTRETTLIEPQKLALVPSNIVVKVPSGYMLAVVPRSSTPRKKGLLIPHGIGIIDNDYCGPEDEIMIQVYNFGDLPVTIERGERIAQGVFIRIAKADFREADINHKTRGGFGSTG
jgi:dUTP pyrophosphatase